MAERLPTIITETPMLIVKVCGITSIEDAAIAVEAGADWIGLNRWPGSPRFVDEAAARRIAAFMRERAARVRIVTLHVDSEVDALRAEASRLRPDYFQVHHDAWRATEIDGVAVLRAFSVGGGEDLAAVDAWPGDPVLIDAKVEGLRGGTGRRIEPTILAGLTRPYLLAGGLTPENVGEAVRRLHPFGVDVASGVESTPGVKDREKTIAFVRAARAGMTR